MYANVGCIFLSSYIVLYISQLRSAGLVIELRANQLIMYWTIRLMKGPSVEVDRDCIFSFPCTIQAHQTPLTIVFDNSFIPGTLYSITFVPRTRLFYLGSKCLLSVDIWRLVSPARGKLDKHRYFQLQLLLPASDRFIVHWSVSGLYENCYWGLMPDDLFRQHAEPSKFASIQMWLWRDVSRRLGWLVLASYLPCGSRYLQLKYDMVGVKVCRGLDVIF